MRHFFVDNDGIKLSAKKSFLLIWNKLFTFLKKNFIVVVSVIAALITCFIVPPDKEYLSYINYKTIFCFFALMILVVAIQNTKVFKIMSAAILKKVHSVRLLITLLVFIPAILAMVMTNDVAIVTFVPFTIVLMQMAHQEKYLPKTIILLTLACNLSGVLSPIGTPQNLFLFDAFNLSPLWFVANMWPLAIFGYGSIILCCLFTKKVVIEPIDTGKRSLPKFKLAYYFALFVLVIISIFDVGKTEKFHLYYIIVPIVFISLLAMDRQALIKAKYSIIIMFVAFFILAGNLDRIDPVKKFLTTILLGNELFVCVGLSQVASNTTSSLLLPKFTQDAYSFIAGACISKYGSPISTMSNFVVTKFFSKHDTDKTFNKKFYLAQIIFLSIMMGAGCLMVFVLKKYQVIF